MSKNSNYGNVTKDGGIIYAESILWDEANHTSIINGSAADYRRFGYYPVVSSYPSTPDGYHIKSAKWMLDNETCVQKYEYEKDPISLEMYDSAIEEHLKREREERGYTSREPSDYRGSGNARWAQDAEDWIAHRDAVMEYGLEVINQYKKTGVEPVYDEFVANIPTIEWTYQDEEE